MGSIILNNKTFKDLVEISTDTALPNAGLLSYSATSKAVSGILSSSTEFPVEYATMVGINYFRSPTTFTSAGSFASGISGSVTDGVVKIVATSGNSNWNSWSHDNDIEANMSANEQFIFSIEIKCDSGSTGKPNIYFKPGMGYYTMKGNVTTEYSTLTYKGHWNKLEDIAFHLGWSGCVGTFYIRKVSFQKVKHVTTDYIYTSRVTFDNKLRIKNIPKNTFASLGYRPRFESIGWLGATTFYLNWFTDGEVWLSTSKDSKSGTNLSTAAQKRKVFILVLHGGGGGGGSSKWGVFKNNAGAGGGGGGMLAACIFLTSTSGSTKITIGGGGTCGKDGGGGSGGGSSYIYNGDTAIWAAYGGSGGAGNAGSGGGGGSTNPSGSGYVRYNGTGFTLVSLQMAQGASGGGVGTTSRPTYAKTITKYSPEGYTNGETLTFSTGYSNDGRTGSGNATGAGGCGYAGKGGGSSGDAQDGKAGSPTGGGSGGGCHAATNRWGGNGGEGRLQVFV